MRFESPWALAILLVLPVIVLLSPYLRRSPALRFSSTRHAVLAARSVRQRLARTPLALRLAALALLIVALARPQLGHEQVRDLSEGIAIEMVVDRSGSMGEEMAFEGQRMTQLEVVKRVFSEFVLGNGDDLEGRASDLVGLVAFARYADTTCPLTLGHGALAHFLDTVHLVQRRSEDGTAIGDAIALAAARLKTAEETLARQREDLKDDYTITSKVMILLTDGQNNRGQRTPLEAAALAAEWGIKIYTIGVGGGGTRISTPFGTMALPGGGQLDERTLEAVATKTGGKYRRADDAESLRAIYDEINELEKSRVETVRYVDYKEWFAPFALMGFAALALEIVLTSTVFRKIP